MSNRFVRSSKYRHVFGRPTRKEQCYDNLRVSKNAWDTNLVKVNPKYISVNWEAGGGGAFAVIPLEEKGRTPERIPLFRGHTAVVLDTDWNPFNDDLIASGSDDGKVCLWRVPENYSLFSDLKPDEIEDIRPVGKLPGHPKKIGHVLFNPAAENVLASTSGDYTIKIWDIEKGSANLTLKVGDVIQSVSWSAEGSMLVTTSRDKKLRIWDARQERPAHEVPGHSGAKNSRAVWMGEHNRVATTGFSKMSDRQIALWDVSSPAQPIGGFQMLDATSGVCMPFWDHGTQCLYLAGKGDGNIRYYEYSNDSFEYLSEYKSVEPQRGVAFLPKRGVDMRENEVMRAFKTVNDTYIEPISFIVPRRAETFQEDIYPPTTGLKPAMGSKEWFEGANGFPPKISMESIYEGQGIREVGNNELRPQVKQPIPIPETKTETTSTPRLDTDFPAATPTTKGPTPSIKEQGASMAAMASKYADAEGGDEHSDDESSFEEIGEPSEKPATDKSATKQSPVTKVPPSIKPQTNAAETFTEGSEVASTSADVKAVNGSSTASGIEREIRDLKVVLAQQTRQLNTLSQTVANLVAEMKEMKAS